MLFSLCTNCPYCFDVLSCSHVVDSALRYAVTDSETQSAFTGKQQRDGVSIVPFVVMGVFGPHRAAHAAVLSEIREGDEPAVSDLAADVPAFENGGVWVQAEQDYHFMDDDVEEAEASKVPNDYHFDRSAYRSIWGTPYVTKR